jgi:hypothetical protein
MARDWKLHVVAVSLVISGDVPWKLKERYTYYFASTDGNRRAVPDMEHFQQKSASRDFFDSTLMPWFSIVTL